MDFPKVTRELGDEVKSINFFSCSPPSHVLPPMHLIFLRSVLPLILLVCEAETRKKICALGSLSTKIVNCLNIKEGFLKVLRY